MMSKEYLCRTAVKLGESDVVDVGKEKRYGTFE